MTWPIAINLIGLALLFIGNALVAHTVGKWGGRQMKQFAWGNTIQAVGFAVSMIGIIVS